MKLQAAFLADAIMANADGTFMVWRGGITHTWAISFPVPIRFVMLLRIEFDPAEAAAVHNLNMHIVHAEKEVAPWQVMPIVLREAPGERRIYFNAMTAVEFMAEQPGEGFVEANVDGDLRLPLLYFTVATIQPQPAN